MTVPLAVPDVIDLTQKIGAIEVEAGADRARFAFTYDGLDLGALDLPAPDGRILPGILRDVAANRFAWRILGRYLARTWYRSLRFEEARGITRVFSGRDIVAKLDMSIDDARSSESLHDALGWSRLLDELFGHIALDGVASAPLRVEASPDPLILELMAPVPAVKAGEPGRWIAGTLAGRLTAMLWLEPGDGAVPGAVLRQRLVERAGYEICVIAVRSGLIGRSPEGASRRPLLANPDTLAGRGDSIRAILGDLADKPGLVLERREGMASGVALSRRVVFPAANGIVLAENATLAGEPLRLTGAAAPPEWVAYLPGCTSSILGAPVQPSLDEAGGDRVGASAAKALLATVTSKLPILMYHRFAADGASASRRFRMDPADFEAQLSWLREHGFRGARLDEWRVAGLSRRPIPGRAVAITVDDACEDFADVAWPLLQRYGFPVTLFVPTGFVGRSNEWDAEAGEVVPVLGWRQLRLLKNEGVQLGAHCVTHRDLSRLPVETIVDELARSRVALSHETGVTPNAVAYPYGIFDDVIRHYAGGCGYSLGLAAMPRRALLHDFPLALPRIEVRGDAGFDAFTRMMADPEPASVRGTDS